MPSEGAKPGLMFKKTQKQEEAIKLLSGSATNILLRGGSRSGKSFLLIYALLVRSLKTESRHVILRKYFNTVKQSIWMDTLPKVMETAFPGLKAKCKWNQSDWFIKLPNGSEIWIGGLDDSERVEKILGKEYSTIFFNECSEISYDSMNVALTRLAQKNNLVKKAYYDENPPKRSHWSYKIWMEGVDPMSDVDEKLPDPENYVTMMMNPQDNLDNIDENYLKILQRMPEAMRRRFLDGEFGFDDADIVRPEWIRPSPQMPDKDDIAATFIFCDPAITEKERATESTCESGIVVLGLDYDGKCHEIQTLSGMWSHSQLKKVLSGVLREWENVSEMFWGVEKVGYQKALGEDLEEMGFPACDYITPDTDKTRRLISVSDTLEDGKVYVNSLKLRKQLLEFPAGRLKDLVDAFTYAVKLYKKYVENYEREVDKLEHLKDDAVSHQVWKEHLEQQEKKEDLTDFFTNLL